RALRDGNESARRGKTRRPFSSFAGVRLTAHVRTWHDRDGSPLTMMHMLHHQTSILHKIDSRFRRELSRLVALDPALEPDTFCPHVYRLLHNGRAKFRPPEYVHHINWPRHIRRGRIT